MPDQERQIVVHKDNRTLEQQHRDRIQRLEREHHGQRLTPLVPRMGGELFPHNWFQDMDRWVAERHRNWYEDVRRMRENLFPLVPLEDFDMRPFPNVSAIIERMERQMEAVRKHMQSVMQREFSPLFSFQKFNEGVLDFLKNAYEVGEDGKLHFIVRFDLKGFNPEDIKVTTGKNWLAVKAHQSIKAPQSSQTREYHRVLYLPDSVTDADFVCHLNKDGILTLDALVKETDHSRIEFDEQRRLAIKPSEENVGTTKRNVTFSRSPMEIPYLAKIGLIVLNDQDGGKKVHVEVPLEPGYGANDIRVYVDAKELVVHGRRPVLEGVRRGDEQYWREFKRTYKLPHTVDALSIRTRIHGDTILVEVPLLRGP